jgi:hypothetical protein
MDKRNTCITIRISDHAFRGSKHSNEILEQELKYAGGGGYTAAGGDGKVGEGAGEPISPFPRPRSRSHQLLHEDYHEKIVEELRQHLSLCIDPSIRVGRWRLISCGDADNCHNYSNDSGANSPLFSSCSVLMLNYILLKL